MSNESEYYEGMIKSIDEEFGQKYDTWICAKCKQELVDSEDFPGLEKKLDHEIGYEPRLYWLSSTEPVCSSCAISAGLPPIDKE